MDSRIAGSAWNAPAVEPASDCADCRVGGRFSGSSVSRRVPAALLIGALALGSITPSMAFAVEGDRDGEGGGAITDGGPPGDVELGAPGDLGADAGSAPAVPDEAAPAPPAVAPEAPAPAPEVPAEQSPETAQTAAPAPDAVAPAESTPASADPAQAVAPAAVAPTRRESPVIEQHRRVKTQRKIARAKRQHARLPATRATSVAVSRTVSAPTRERVASAAPAPAVSPPGPARASVRARNRPARPGARVHVVAFGESLWSIASDHLGANASSAEVGREVERLWQVNRARIGTGDRNLLIAGTVLRLA